MNWVRVTKTNPCAVCGRPDWCTVGEFFFCCMRVQSAKPCTNGGWLHPLNEKYDKPIFNPEPPRPEVDCEKMMIGWLVETKEDHRTRFAKSLGVSHRSLFCVGAAWAPPHRAWAFAMKDGQGRTVGIRLRSESGRKWSVPGSHQGLFIPNLTRESTVLLVEGATDVAAGLELGFFTIGRPSCSGGISQVTSFIKWSGIRRVIIVADNDGPGVLGAKTLQPYLPVTSAIVILPSKDLRSFLNFGGTSTVFQSTLSQCVWQAK